MIPRANDYILLTFLGLKSQSISLDNPNSYFGIFFFSRFNNSRWRYVEFICLQKWSESELKNWTWKTTYGWTSREWKTHETIKYSCILYLNCVPKSTYVCHLWKRSGTILRHKFLVCRHASCTYTLIYCFVFSLTPIKH